MDRSAVILFKIFVVATLVLGVQRSYGQRQPWVADPIGVNLAGADRPKRPGVVGEAYIAPVGQEFRYYRSKHIRLFRISFYWESIQSQLNGPLDAEEVRRLDAIVAEARALHVSVILDVHSYDRWHGNTLGSDPALESGFADMWRKLAQHFSDQEGIFAYGLMNEPHDTGNTWPHTAQIAIDGIRTVDRRHTIILSGDQWSSARAWPVANPNLLEVRDLCNRLLYEGHVYFDADNSGVYKHTYDEDHVEQNVGVQRVMPFVAWLQTHHVRGIVTEIGNPGNDPHWNKVLANTLMYLRANHITAVYWAGGPLWHHYPLSIDPTQSGDASQMQVLEQFAVRRRWWHIF
jgi:aryl-phospho-beta-D-glucosidase BglC (GH1 family)